MVITAFELPDTATRPNPKPMLTWEEFRAKYLNKEDKFKYEWVNGQVEKTERTRDKMQF